MKVNGEEERAITLSLSPPPDRRPSLKPATSHHSTAAHRPKTPASTSRVRNRQVPDACAQHCTAPHASGPPPTPSSPPSLRQAPRRLLPEQGLGIPQPLAPTSRPRMQASPGSSPSGSHLALTCKIRKPGNVSSNLGAPSVLRTCFSLSSPPSWFQRQAAAAELPNASMEAARR